MLLNYNSGTKNASKVEYQKCMPIGRYKWKESYQKMRSKYLSIPVTAGEEVQGPSVAMVLTKVRLFYPLAHVQSPMEN